MTPEQEDRLIVVLETIAKTLQNIDKNMKDITFYQGRIANSA